MNPIKPERINPLIKVIGESNQLNMVYWQHTRSGNTVWTLKDLHICGNEACIGGYVGLLPEFKKIGGTIGCTGEPELHNIFSGWHSVFAYLTGQTDFDDRCSWAVVVRSIINDDATVRLPPSLEGKLAMPGWASWKACHAVAILEWLRDLEKAPTPYELASKVYETVGDNDPDDLEDLKDYKNATWRYS